MRKPHFAPKADPRFKHVQIYLQFTYQRGKFLRYYTGLVVPPEYWDKKEERVKPDRKFPDGPEINLELDGLQVEAVKIAKRYQLNQTTLTNEIFKKELDVFLGKRDPSELRMSFFDFFDRFINERAANPNYSKGSITVYRTTYRHVKEFAEETYRREIDFPDFNHTFFSDFSNYLFAKDFRTNYVYKLTSTLKTVLREADRREVSPDLKIKDGWLVASKEEPPAIYLNEDEIGLLYNLDLSQNERLCRVRDLFLIGCFTGLRFSDFTELKPGNFKKTADGKQFIEITTQKTGQKVTIPAKAEVREILARYDNELPTAISNQKFNDYLKELCRLAGLDEPTTMTRFRSGKREDKTVPKCDLVTTHTARRSFATNAYKAGVPVKYIMSVTGHKTEKEFYKYIRIQPEEHALLVSDNPFFK